MDVTPSPYTSNLRDFRTDTGDIDYAAYDRLARQERAAAFAMVGHWFGRGARYLADRLADLLDGGRRRALTH